MAATPTNPKPAWSRLIRYVGVGVAVVEVAFLTVWMGLVFGLMDGLAPHLWSLSPILLDSLPALIAGMTLAAALGGTVGLAAAGVLRAIGRLARDRTERPPN